MRYRGLELPLMEPASPEDLTYPAVPDRDVLANSVEIRRAVEAEDEGEGRRGGRSPIDKQAGSPPDSLV